MEGFGHDVAFKIKSAIKAKLIELDVYVDDELPDYIIVMVANKRSKSQMTEDLSLFLGDNTEKFTDWLHEVLEKLHSVTLDSSQKPDVKPNGAPVTVSSASEVVSTSEKASTDDATEVNIKVEVESDKYLTLDLGESAENEAQDEMLTIKAEDDLLGEPEEFLEEAPPLAAVSKSKKIKAVKPIIAAQPLAAVTPTQHINSDVTSVESGFSPMNRKRKAPSSAVGAILQREFPQEEDEDDPGRASAGAVASVVQIAQRRSSLPPDRQANKILLLKAVDEAQKSIMKHSEKNRGRLRGNEPSPQLFTRAYIERQRRNEKFLTVLGKEKSPLYADEELPPSLEVDHGASPKTPTDSDHDQEESDENERSMVVEEIAEMTSVSKDSSLIENPDRVVVSQTNSPDGTQGSPKFIITLDGVDSSRYESELGESQWMETDECLTLHDDADTMLINDQTSEETYPTVMDAEEYEECDTGAENACSSSDAKPSQNERCRYWPACKNGSGCVYRHPSTPCKTFPNCKFGNQCLYIHPNCKFDAACRRRDCPFTHASPRNYQVNPGVAVSNPMSQRMRKTMILTSQNSSQKTVCRNFPVCSNVDCQFYHPKPCRYGQGCTRNDCIFFHPPLPTPDKLKWNKVSNPEQTPDTRSSTGRHISDRAFAVGRAKQKLSVAVATIKS